MEDQLGQFSQTAEKRGKINANDKKISKLHVEDREDSQFLHDLE